MPDLDTRYDELDDSITSVRLQLEAVTDKYVKQILEECLENLENQFNEIKDTVEESRKKELEEQEREYERSVL
jgi:hypothetical protein